MKQNFLLLTAVITMMLFTSNTTVSAANVNVQGTWQILEANGNPIPPSFKQIKLITDNSFFWYVSDTQGNVHTGAGGSYIVKDNVYTEAITSALPGMSHLLGKKAIYEVRIEGDMMYISSTVVGDTFSNTEIWKRVTNPSK